MNIDTVQNALPVIMNHYCRDIEGVGMAHKVNSPTIQLLDDDRAVLVRVLDQPEMLSKSCHGIKKMCIFS